MHHYVEKLQKTPVPNDAKDEPREHQELELPEIKDWTPKGLDELEKSPDNEDPNSNN